MTNRIRKKVEMVQQCGANTKNNLSDLDYKIYQMLPAHNCAFDLIFDAPNSTEICKKHPEINSDACDLDNTDIDYSRRTLVVQTAEELDAFSKESLIEEDWDDCGGEFENESTDIAGRSSIVNPIDELQNQEFAETIAHPSFSQVQSLHQVATVSASESSNTGVRIPDVQKERLVQLVQKNFLKAVGQFAGANGKFIKANLWHTFAKELNTLGPSRTAEQWKTTFNNIKAGAKAKLADDHNKSTKTKSLSRLEEKIVSIYGMNNMDGHQSLGESGFRYSKTVPQTHDQFAESRNNANGQEAVEDDMILIESADIENCRSGLTSRPEREFISRAKATFTSRAEGAISSKFDGFVSSHADGAVNRSQSLRATSPLDHTYHEDDVTLVESADIENCGFRLTSRPEREFISHSKETLKSRVEGSNSSQNNRVAKSRSNRVVEPSNWAQSPRQSAAEELAELEADVLSEIIQEIWNEPEKSPPRSRVSPMPNPAVGTGNPDVAIISSQDSDFARETTSCRNAARPCSRVSSVSNRAIGTRKRDVGITSRTERDFAREPPSRTEGTFTSRSKGVSTIRPRVSSRTDAVDNSISQAQSSRLTFAPPRVRRTIRSSSPTDEIEYITDINQLFNDQGSDNESAGRHSSGRRSIRHEDQNNETSKKRDRSNLRNKHTGYEMVQRSITSQERFIEDSNRNHSEMMYLQDRNHLEMIGIFTSTLKSFMDVAREFVKKS